MRNERYCSFCAIEWLHVHVSLGRLRMSADLHLHWEWRSPGEESVEQGWCEGSKRLSGRVVWWASSELTTADRDHTELDTRERLFADTSIGVVGDCP